VEQWLENNLCTGCAACENICPEDAIRLSWDRDGFSHPVIDQDKCINCGKCSRVCPVLKRLNHETEATPLKAKSPDIFAAWSNDYPTRYNSTSGGVFSELARAALARGARICGAVYDGEDHLVRHAFADDETGLEAIRQSKYIQSEIGKTYRQIEQRLKDGGEVLFCGAPCQVAGLYEYLGKDYERLATVDFICRGVNSPLAYRAWLAELEEEYGAKVTRVWFKNKEKGWNRFSTRVDFANGRMYRKTRYEDLFMRAYIEKNLFIRPSCTKCRFKGLPRTGDITLADFWKVDKKYDEDLGTSMVILNNEKGAALFEAAKPALSVYQRSYREALRGNLCLKASVKTGEKSAEFFELLHAGNSFSTAFNTVAGELQPKVSVILPVARRNGRLIECVESICRQDYERLEILLLRTSDDPVTKETCDQAAQTDPRIRYMSLEGDVNIARNLGLENATGRYIQFCSGSEMLGEGFYTTLIGQMEERGANVACFGYRNAKGSIRCRNAFNGTGNLFGLMDLALTDEGSSSEYTGYGVTLENKLFRRDAIFSDETPVSFETCQYDMTDAFWLMTVAYNCKTALFTSKTMFHSYAPEPAVRANASMALQTFFDKQADVLANVEGTKGFIYEKLLRLCFEYELELMVSARNLVLPELNQQLQEHLLLFHQIPWTDGEKLDIFYQNTQAKKDRHFLKSRISGLEQTVGELSDKEKDLLAQCDRAKKDRHFLKNKISGLEQTIVELSGKEKDLLAQCDRAGKDRQFLKNKISGMEKQISDLESKKDEYFKKYTQSKKDCQFLKNRIAGIEKDKQLLENRISGMEKQIADLDGKRLEYLNLYTQARNDRQYLKNKTARMARENAELSSERLDYLNRYTQANTDRQYLKKKVARLERELADIRSIKPVKAVLKLRGTYRKAKGSLKRS